MYNEQVDILSFRSENIEPVDKKIKYESERYITTNY